MGEVRAFGVFETKGQYLFRSSAYLQFGAKEESLGSFLLLNPGSASPINMDDFESNPNQLHPVKIDPTMRQIIQLVYKIYGTEQLSGRITIYNLFSLRNPKNVDAIKLFEELATKGELSPNESVASIEKLKEHPWICCAWGIHPPNRYRQLGHAKTVWKRALRDAGIPQFGKLHENGRDYYHIRPQKVADQEILIEELYESYQS